MGIKVTIAPSSTTPWCIWRIGEGPKPAQSSIDEDSINALNVRISQAGRVSLSDVPVASTSGPDDSSLAASFNQRLKELSGDELAYDGPLTGSGHHMMGLHAVLLCEQPMSLASLHVLPCQRVRWMCTGPVLREAIERKYGKTYDLSIVRREIPGKTLVALNVSAHTLSLLLLPLAQMSASQVWGAFTSGLFLLSKVAPLSCRNSCQHPFSCKLCR